MEREVIMSRFLCLFILIAWPTLTAADDDRSSLIAQIEASGQNEFEDERHAVQVDACQLTTYR